MAATASTPPLASLQGLPPELRLRIYTHLLSDPDASTIKLRNRIPNRACSDIHGPYAWLQLCRVIRAEILPLFYQSVGLELLDGFHENKLVQWTEVVGAENVREVRRVRFFCRGKCTMFGLQPDTDYCLREYSLDLTWPIQKAVLEEADPTRAEKEILLCSNAAPGCIQLTRNKLTRALETLAREASLPGGAMLRVENIAAVWRAVSRSTKTLYGYAAE